jgi:transposase
MIEGRDGLSSTGNCPLFGLTGSLCGHASLLAWRPLPVNPRGNFLQIQRAAKGGTKSMSDVRRKYDEDFKKNAVKLSFASSKSVAQVARDLGVSDAMLYRWRQKYTPEGDKTRYATLEDENKALRLRNAEQAIEIDMLKKASAYFASLRK